MSQQWCPVLLLLALAPLWLEIEVAALSTPNPTAREWCFAYGANMAGEILVKRGVRPLESKPALGKGMKLAFRHRGAFATVIPAGSDDEVHGVLLYLEPDDLQRLVERETGYRLSRQILFTTYEGEEIPSRFFESSPDLLLSQSLPPTERYLGLLRRGAKENDLVESYQEFLASHPCVPEGEPLGPEYSQTPSNAVAASFLAVVVALAAYKFLM